MKNADIYEHRLENIGCIKNDIRKKNNKEVNQELIISNPCYEGHFHWYNRNFKEQTD